MPDAAFIKVTRSAGFNEDRNLSILFWLVGGNNSLSNPYFITFFHLNVKFWDY